MKKISQKLDASIKKSVDSGDLPMAVGMITTAQETIYVGNYNNCQLNHSQTIDEHSVFYLASMTKPITTAAALLLNQRNQFDFDVPITKWIPSIKNNLVLVKKVDRREYTFRKPTREITARDLITHSSGFAHPAWNELAYEQHKANNSIQFPNKPEDLYTLMFNPGERWEYSNTNINLLANIIEIISKENFGKFVKENIFDPLGMDSTYWQLNKSMQSRRVDKFNRSENGNLLSLINNDTSQNSLQVYGAGGLLGSAEDYAKFLRCIMNNGIANGLQILSPKSISLMTTDQFKSDNIGTLYSTNLKTAKNIDLLFGTEGAWSFGFLINKYFLPTGRNPGSLCWFGSNNTYFWIDMKLGISGIFLTQVLPCGDERARTSFEHFESTFYSNFLSANY